MFSWAKKKLEPAPAPRMSPTISPIWQWADDEIPHYPPFMKGLPAVPPEKLLTTQIELLDRVSAAALTTPQSFARYYTPTITRFASFAHLLPASQSHHHRGAGGLLRHSLEVGLWALRSADRILFETARLPSQRRELEPRWQFAVFAAGLCHDAGKPVTDITVTNSERTSTWKPIKQNLYDWIVENKVKAYYLDWREGRARQHTALSNLIADRIIGADALEWIEEGSTDLIVWLLESLSNNPGPINQIHDLVIMADQASVDRDLKSLGVAMAGYDLGVPVERHLTDVMRRLVQEGVWRVNEPGARLWKLGGDLYLTWPAAGEEIARQVREDKIPGIPRTSDSILDMLVERQIAFVRDSGEDDHFWRIAPACLAEKLPNVALSAIRLRDDALISSVPIPPVDGRIVEKRDEDAMPAEPLARSGEAAKVSVNADLSDSRNDDPPIQEKKPEIPAKPEIILDGAIGEALKALVRDIATGAKRLGEDMRVDGEGHALLRWPDAFSACCGLSKKEILAELSRCEWLWINPAEPLKKAFDAQLSGAPTKVIRLKRGISAVLAKALADAGVSLVSDSAAPATPVMPATPAAAGPVSEDVLAVLKGHPAARQANDGWWEMSRRDAISACRRGGIMVTFGQFEDLVRQDTDRFALDGVILRYKG